MAATSLLARLRADHPAFTFVADAPFFSWVSSSQTIQLGPTQPYYDLLTLHELGHATLGHRDYRQDIELLQLEVAAWQQAERLATAYGVAYDPDLVEQHLDTYRDWIARRSACPTCAQAGYQTPDGIYHCPACLSRWRTKVNRIRL